MAVTLAIDTANRIIDITTLPSGGLLSVDAEVDIYSQVKDLWFTTRAYRGLRMPISVFGGRETIPGEFAAIQVYVRTDLGWTLRVTDADQEVTVVGNLYSFDPSLPVWTPRPGRSIAYYGERSSLAVIKDADSGGTGDCPTAAEIAQEVWCTELPVTP